MISFSTKAHRSTMGCDKFQYKGTQIDNGVGTSLLVQSHTHQQWELDKLLYVSHRWCRPKRVRVASPRFGHYHPKRLDAHRGFGPGFDPSRRRAFNVDQLSPALTGIYKLLLSFGSFSNTYFTKNTRYQVWSITK